jgi:hypothetical protein
MRTTRGIIAGPFGQTVIIASIASLAYFLVFGVRFYFFGSVPGGDTQNIWSVYWIAIYSLWHFHELLWWDPTSLNGWPAYYLNNHGWTTMLSPFQAAQLLVGTVVNSVWPLEITPFLVVQKTLLVQFINIFLVALIAREVVATAVARLFVPLVYALCQIQFLGYVAGATVEALPAALLLLCGILRYANRCTPDALLFLLLSSGVYAVSVNYMTLTSHVYPLGFFVLILLLLDRGLAKSVYVNAKALAASRLGAAALTAGVALSVIGALVFAVGVAGHLAQFARVTTGSIPYDINRINAWSAPGYGIVSTEIWTALFYWIPYSDLHAFTMKFDPYSSGHEYRYLGLATLPLLLVALTSGLRNRYTACFGGAFFFCIAFVAATVMNLPMALLIEKSTIFQNIRTMALIMPRDLVSIFPVLVAAIGLDELVRRRPATADVGMRRLAAFGVLGLVVLAVWCLLELATFSQNAPIRKSLGHIGIYLLVFSVIVLLAMHTGRAWLARNLGWALVAIAFVDLTISASDQWINNNGAGRYYHGKWAAAMKAEQTGVGPIASQAEAWPGLYYQGMVHNVHHGGPHFGPKPWLAMVTRPAWQPVVDNWDPEQRMVKQYPYFKFFTNGSYIPEAAIHNLDSVPPPRTELPTRLVERRGSPYVRHDGRYYPIVRADVGIVERAEKSSAWPDHLAMAGWALEKPANRPPRLLLVFVGDSLWYAGSPNEMRENMKASFEFVFRAVPEPAIQRKASVRVFAITQDDRAAELRYAAGYPFSTADDRSAWKKDDAPAQAAGPAFYLHDPSLVKADVPQERLHIRWSVREFTFNHLKVEVNLPQAAYMLFMDNYDRGWRAYVNGARIPVHRANFAFKAVYLPRGPSSVEWRYTALRSQVAWIVYYAVFILFAALCAWRWRRKSG